MPIVRTITLALLTIAIALAVLVGQAAFRLDRTLLRHDYLRAEIEAWFEPLSDEANHERFVGDLLAEIRRGLGWQIPVQIQSIVTEAAHATFSRDWIVSFLQRTHTAAYRVMRGDRTPVRLTLPLAGFLGEIATRARAELPAEVANEVGRELSAVPASIDLWAELDEESQASIALWLRRIPLISILLQYALPGLFIGLTLVFRRPGSAMVASGAGIAIGGGLMLFVVRLYAVTAGASVGRAARTLVPGRPAWIEQPVADTISEAIAGGTGFAALLVGLGVVIAGLGVLVIRLWSDSIDPLVGGTRKLLGDR